MSDKANMKEPYKIVKHGASILSEEVIPDKNGLYDVICLNGRGIRWIHAHVPGKELIRGQF